MCTTIHSLETITAAATTCQWPVKCNAPLDRGGYCWQHANLMGIDKPVKPKKAIAKVSKKQRRLNNASKPTAELLDEWFEDTRRKLTGICQCGCGEKSQKADDTWYRGSCCHIFPKNDFESVMVHPLNYVERRMFGGCHSQMDDTSITRWPYMADWDDICAKFRVLEPLLTPEEKTRKFYHQLKEMVENN